MQVCHASGPNRASQLVLMSIQKTQYSMKPEHILERHALMMHGTPDHAPACASWNLAVLAQVYFTNTTKTCIIEHAQKGCLHIIDPFTRSKQAGKQKNGWVARSTNAA